jgi:hypothetical protein
MSYCMRPCRKARRKDVDLLQASQLNQEEKEGQGKGKPVLSKLIGQNIRTIIRMRTSKGKFYEWND